MIRSVNKEPPPKIGSLCSAFRKTKHVRKIIETLTKLANVSKSSDR